jgi:3-phosphoshikimate 1-carboxyvinyltransferase
MVMPSVGPKYLEYSEQFGMDVPTYQLSNVTVSHWPNSGWQMDEAFRDYAFFRHLDHLVPEPTKGQKIPDLFREKWDRLATGVISRMRDLGDSIMTAIVIAPLGKKDWKFTDLGRLRLQETERVHALKTELTKCGAKVIEEGDTLTIYPSELHGAEIETYNDHRMAMCFAILGLKVPGIKIINPACVKKTFPNFFQKLATPPPKGLGATILDASGRKLELDELFAD